MAVREQVWSHLLANTRLTIGEILEMGDREKELRLAGPPDGGAGGKVARDGTPAMTPKEAVVGRWITQGMTPAEALARWVAHMGDSDGA